MLPVQLAAVDQEESVPRPVQTRPPDAAKEPMVPDSEVVRGPPWAAGTRSATVPLKLREEMAVGATPERLRVTVRRSAESAETAVTVPAGESH